MEYQQHQQPLGPPVAPLHAALLPPLPPPAPAHLVQQQLGLHGVQPLHPPLAPPQPQHNTALQTDDERWTQYHQLWRQHVYINDKSNNNKDGLDDKKDDSELWTQSAFLGPNLWEKTLPYDSDFKYVDLDEFLSENGMPGDGLAGSGHLGAPGAFGHSAGLSVSSLVTQVTKRERSPSPSECMSPDTINPPLSPAESTFSMASSGRDFDPRTRAFSDEELKPQPMIKKSRKQFVPDDLKDDKYWARRRKNNMAAKRSRDARRMKENQIALRAGYLEKENMGLRQELELLKKENHILREKLSKLSDV